MEAAQKFKAAEIPQPTEMGGSTTTPSVAPIQVSISRISN
jgi:hypothetical protein